MILSVLGNLPASEGRCPCCGEPNGCRFDPSAPQNIACWCLGVKVGLECLRTIQEHFGNSACLCHNCLQAVAGDPAEPPVEGRDYYLTPEGLMVFTALYHLRRGRCCDSGCRHCPYPKPAP